MKPFLKFFRWKYSFYLVTFCIFFVWTFFVDGNSVIAQFDLSAERNEYLDGIKFYDEQLEQINKEQAEVLGNDDAIEKFARETYLMKKEGETVFVIVDSDGNMLD